MCSLCILFSWEQNKFLSQTFLTLNFSFWCPFNTYFSHICLPFLWIKTALNNETQKLQKARSFIFLELNELFGACLSEFLFNLQQMKPTRLLWNRTTWWTTKKWRKALCSLSKNLGFSSFVFSSSSPYLKKLQLDHTSTNFTKDTWQSLNEDSSGNTYLNVEVIRIIMRRRRQMKCQI